MLASWPKAQCVGATGSCAFGRTRRNRSGLSRAASARMSAVCTTRLRLRSDRPFTLPRDRRATDPLVIGPIEPFRRHPPVPLTPAHIHFPTTCPRRCDRIQNFHNAHRLISRDGRREPLSRASTRQRKTGTPLTLRQFGRKKPLRARVIAAIQLAEQTIRSRSPSPDAAARQGQAPS